MIFQILLDVSFKIPGDFHPFVLMDLEFPALFLSCLQFFKCWNLVKTFFLHVYRIFVSFRVLDISYIVSISLKNLQSKPFFYSTESIGIFHHGSNKVGKENIAKQCRRDEFSKTSQEAGPDKWRWDWSSHVQNVSKMMTKMLLELPGSSTRKEPAKRNDRPLQSSPQHKGKEKKKPKHKDWSTDRKFTSLDQKLETILENLLAKGMVHLPKVIDSPSIMGRFKEQFCKFHRAIGHGTENCFVLKNIIQDHVDKNVLGKAK